ncbi:mucin-2-like [Condylostylus longicornis]|uniref:mucin-2-like n=1 Tax=Condylostylus longicornis TaxID=2530218 RepID=UPI00244DE490|nr:mucin-2-like [Condylostylus longicornis]
MACKVALFLSTRRENNTCNSIFRMHLPLTFYEDAFKVPKLEFYEFRVLTWIIYCFLITITEQKSKALQFRMLPIKSEKLTIAELPSYNLFEPYGPGTYAFGYEIEDNASNNIQFRDEEKLENGTVRGSYGLVRPNGLVSITRYFADNSGYHSSTQTFNQNDKKPSILTSTLSPLIELSSPSDVMFLDVPNPATISSLVAQHILEQNKVDLATQSSNIPITEIFSDDDKDTKTGNKSDNDKKFTGQSSATSSIQQITPTHIPNLPVIGPIKIPTQNSNSDTNKVDNQTGIKPSSDEISNILMPSNPSDITNIFQTLLPHIPNLPISSSTTPLPQGTTTPATAENLSDEKNSVISSSSQPNIFENILPHIPQVSLPPNMIGATTKKPTATSMNDLFDNTELENSSSSTTAATTTNKPTSNLPSVSNVFENLLPHPPQIPISISMDSTTKPSQSSTSSSSNLLDENETSESSMPSVQSSTLTSTTNKPTSTTIDGFPPLSQIFGFLDPANFPILKPPANIPNKPDGSETSSGTAAMDTILDNTTPIVEPVFAIIHKNATLIPIYADDGTTIGIQLVNNLIPSNFHIIPFIIPSNYLQNQHTTESSQQNIAHDEVSFEETIPNFVNDKFHDPLNDSDDDDTWKSDFSRKRKGNRRNKIRRNNNFRRRYRSKN